jgi:hypothetical protein
VLDGIREGVQGVSRSIIAALSPTAAGYDLVAPVYAESVLPRAKGLGTRMATDARTRRI